MTIKTVREILEDFQAEPTIGIDADLYLTGDTLENLKRLLGENKNLAGVEVLEADGTRIGILPRSVLSAYAISQSERADDLSLGGAVVLDAPIFHCTEHQPERCRFSSLGTAPVCPVCGRSMKRK